METGHGFQENTFPKKLRNLIPVLAFSLINCVIDLTSSEQLMEEKFWKVLERSRLNLKAECGGCGAKGRCCGTLFAPQQKKIKSSFQGTISLNTADQNSKGILSTPITPFPLASASHIQQEQPHSIPVEQRRS